MKPAPVAVSTAVNKPPTTTPKPSWLGRVLRIGLLILLLLIAAVLALPHALPWLLQQQGIDFDWHNPEWQRNGFSVSQLQLTLPSDDGPPYQLQVDNLRLNWAWQTFPIQRLQASRLQLYWPITGAQTATDSANQAMPEALLKWLPQHIELQDIDANLPGLGHLQGALNLQASAQGVLWQPTFIHSQLTLKDPQGAWLDSIPAEFQPTQLSAQITTHPDHQDTPNGQQLLTVDLHSQGPMRLQLNGLLDLQQTPEWQGTLKNAQLFMQLDALTLPAARAKQLQVRAYFTAHADTEKFTVSLTKQSSLEVHKLQLPDIAQAQKVTVQLAESTIQGRSSAPEQLQVHSPFKAHIEQLSAEQLHTQDWDFNGTLSGQLPQLELTGDLTGQQGLSLASKIRLLENSIQGSATLKEIFFKAGNPLQTTLKDWPELISFNSGRLRSQLDFTLPNTGPLKVSINGSASGLSGIINRSEMKNLELQFSGQLSGQTLKLGIPNLTIEQLNPGILLGQIQLKNAHYQAKLDNLLEGVADWQRVQVNLLNGSVWLETQKLDLQQPQTLALQVQGLELQELLKVYPAEGLAGNATIDGQLPIHFANGELYIEAGQLKARQPGVLQFQSEKIHALGQSNPAMRLVADALEDFHFSLLSSGLSYDQSGKLLLNVRLEGQNPDVEKGRPIHLNINLEEDIPALLASIQLSGQVSEIIQKRVRERLEKR